VRGPRTPVIKPTCITPSPASVIAGVRHRQGIRAPVYQTDDRSILLVITVKQIGIGIQPHSSELMMRFSDRCVLTRRGVNLFLGQELSSPALRKLSRDSIVEEVDGAGIGHRVVDLATVRPPGSAVFGARTHGQRAISAERNAATELVESFGVRALHV
jgi:hypothetical protein